MGGVHDGWRWVNIDVGETDQLATHTEPSTKLISLHTRPTTATVACAYTDPGKATL
jgi:hypothetical protein